jgi:hypothetical protein
MIYGDIGTPIAAKSKGQPGVHIHSIRMVKDAVVLIALRRSNLQLTSC